MMQPTTGGAEVIKISSNNYAKLANDMYLLGAIISSEGLTIMPAKKMGGYNSNSAIYTIANLTGKGRRLIIFNNHSALASLRKTRRPFQWEMAVLARIILAQMLDV